MLNKTSLNFIKNINVYPSLINKKSIPESKLRRRNDKNNRTSQHFLSKNELNEMKLIGQFDNKFVIMVRRKDNAIVIFDQHAVHERILYEFYSSLLFNSFYDIDSKENSDKVRLNLFEVIYGKFQLKKCIRLNVKKFNIDIDKFTNQFQRNKTHSLFYYTFSIDDNDNITFYTLPIIFDKIHKIENLLKMFSYIISDIDYYIELYKSKSPKLLNLFDMVVRSKACRNAIKFNDELSDDFIINLISSLSECKNPFLCAHGRHNFYVLNKH